MSLLTCYAASSTRRVATTTSSSSRRRHHHSHHYYSTGTTCGPAAGSAPSISSFVSRTSTRSFSATTTTGTTTHRTSASCLQQEGYYTYSCHQQNRRHVHHYAYRNRLNDVNKSSASSHQRSSAAHRSSSVVPAAAWTAAAASSDDGPSSSSSSSQRVWEVLLSGLVAFAASATLVVAFPSSSTTTTKSSSSGHQQHRRRHYEEYHHTQPRIVSSGHHHPHHHHLEENLYNTDGDFPPFQTSSAGGGSSSTASSQSGGSGVCGGGGGDGGGPADTDILAYGGLMFADQQQQQQHQHDDTHHVVSAKRDGSSAEQNNMKKSKNNNDVSAAKDQSEGRRKNYDVSVRAIKGGRVTMEDEYYVSKGGRFAAVFDGHGGGGVSQFLKNKLYEWVVLYLKQKHWEDGNDDVDVSTALYNEANGATSPVATTTTTNMDIDSGISDKVPSISSYVAALRMAFGQVERDVLDKDALKYQGSTAVAVLLHESTQDSDDHRQGHQRTLVSANVGDSRAILSRRGRAIDLTRDHKPNEEREKARILAMGETIEWDSFSKVHRVRNLSLSRAIGDRYAKPAVSGECEIKLFPIAEDDDEFFLLASDGLWDVMTSQEVVSYVHKRFDAELKRVPEMSKEDKENYKLVLRRNMARSVAREAYRRGSGDNICVLMVWLKDFSPSS